MKRDGQSDRPDEWMIPASHTAKPSPPTCSDPQHRGRDHSGARRARAASWHGLQGHIVRSTHGSGPCRVAAAFRALHVSEVAPMVDELSWRGRHRLVRLSGVTDDARDLAERVVRCAPRLEPDDAHTVAEALVQPIVRDLKRLFDNAITEQVWPVLLLEVWPPGIVRVLVQLLWELGDLPDALLRGSDFEDLCRAYGAGAVEE